MANKKSKNTEVESESAGDEDLEEEEYIVEKIVDKRTRYGKTEYYLKWKGFSEDQNTWEPEDNLNCPDLIGEFESKHKAKSKPKAEAKKKKPEVNGTPAPVQTISAEPDEEVHPKVDETQKNGFDRGLIAERIIGATDSSGQLMFLMKWKNIDEADLVPAKVANVKCPQVVIQFYEERLTWHNGDDDKEDASKRKEASNTEASAATATI